LRVAIHLEPYGGRSIASIDQDIRFLNTKHGITDFWIYLVNIGGSPAAWRPTTDGLAGLRLFMESGNVGAFKRGEVASFAAAAGFDGIYTYDAVRFAPSDFGAICSRARSLGLLCSPSVSPGYDATRAGPDTRVVHRDSGGRYDRTWDAALAAGADVVSITSYNEWHEGTQIEPAQPKFVPMWALRYDDYEGDYGRTGLAAERAYLERTAGWASRAHNGT
jgi:hypothetical protein